MERPFASGVRFRRAPLAAFPGLGVGLLPFFVFSFLFIILPTFYLVTGSLQKDDQPSLQNYADLGTGIIPLALLTSIEISLVTAIAGGVLGFLMAYAIILGGLPRFLRTGSDLLRGGLELRGHPARVGIRVHPRPARRRHHVPPGDLRLQHLRHGLQALGQARPRSSSTCTSRSR